MPVLARSQLPLLLLITLYARSAGMATDPARTAPAGASRLIVALSAGAAVVILGWLGILIVTAPGPRDPGDLPALLPQEM